MLAIGELLLCSVALANTEPMDPGVMRRLLSNVGQAMTRLEAPLDMNESELASLIAPALQLENPATLRPFVTSRGYPLPFYIIEPEARTCRPGQAVQTVLFLGTIHADEVSPAYSSFHTLLEILQNPARRPPNTRVIFAPLLNPEGLVRSTQLTGHSTRANGNGVDLNRNFRARNPQNETQFVQSLIQTYHPTHIISLHGPFGWHDYDGPAEGADATPQLREHTQSWLARINRAGRRPMGINEDFGVYRGSLGDYAGSGLRRHVLTVEYPHEAGRFARDDWYNFGDSLIEALNPGALRPGDVLPMPSTPLATPSQTGRHRVPPAGERNRPASRSPSGIP